MENVFASKHPLVAHKLALLRDQSTDPKTFPELVRELASLLVYEATEDLLTTPFQVQTPLALSQAAELRDKILLIPICRAGLRMLQGARELRTLSPACTFRRYRPHTP